MTTLQRRILATVAGLGFLLTAVLVLTGGGGGDGERLAVEAGPEKTTTTTTVEEPAPPEAESPQTTVPLVPLTTGVPIPNAVQAPPPTTAPTATRGTPRTSASGTGSKASAGPFPDESTVGPGGAVLKRPSDTTTTRPVDKAKGCHSANDPGWRIDECGALRSGGTVLLWLVEKRGAGIRTLVLREQTAGRWAVVLAANDDSGSSFSSVGVRGEDVSGDGQPELVFGFHRRGGQRVLAVDVVDASPAVVVHRELAQGTARTAKGRLDTWSAAGEAFDHVVIRFSDGAWRASPPQRVARGDVPPGMV